MENTTHEASLCKISSISYAQKGSSYMSSKDYSVISLACFKHIHTKQHLILQFLYCHIYGVYVTYRRGLNRRVGFIDALPIQLVTTSIIELQIISALYSSQLHTHTPTHIRVLILLQSTQAVSWQRIYNSLTVTAASYEVFFAQLNSFRAISSQSPSTADSLNYLL
jgi:hypothetical protein